MKDEHFFLQIAREELNRAQYGRDVELESLCDLGDAPIEYSPHGWEVLVLRDLDLEKLKERYNV